jgi:acyl carrier protein
LRSATRRGRCRCSWLLHNEGSHAHDRGLSLASDRPGFIEDTFFADGFADDTSFLEQAIIDSTGMLELVLFVETTFGVKVADDELVPENLDSVESVVAFIERKRQGS